MTVIIPIKGFAAAGNEVWQQGRVCKRTTLVCVGGDSRLAKQVEQR